MNEYKERVELRVATIMSINESLVTECSLIKQAHEFGMPAIAITDWENKKGMQNLYRLLENMDFCRYDRIVSDHTNAPALLLSELNDNREGLLVGLQSEYLGVNDIERFKDLCSRIHCDYHRSNPAVRDLFFPWSK